MEGEVTFLGRCLRLVGSGINLQASTDRRRVLIKGEMLLEV